MCGYERNARKIQQKSRKQRKTYPNPPQPGFTFWAQPSASVHAEQTRWINSRNGASSPEFLCKILEVKIWYRRSSPYKQGCWVNNGLSVSQASQIYGIMISIHQCKQKFLPARLPKSCFAQYRGKSLPWRDAAADWRDWSTGNGE